MNVSEKCYPSDDKAPRIRYSKFGIRKLIGFFRENSGTPYSLPLASGAFRRPGCRAQAAAEVVHRALVREADEDDRRVQEKLAALREIQARVAALPERRPGFTDDDLYDEDGNPIL